MEEACIRIAEGGLSFFKPHSMLGPIAPILPLVPFEPEHVYILSRYNVDCNRVAKGLLAEMEQQKKQRKSLSELE